MIGAMPARRRAWVVLLATALLSCLPRHAGASCGVSEDSRTGACKNLCGPICESALERRGRDPKTGKDLCPKLREKRERECGTQEGRDTHMRRQEQRDAEKAARRGSLSHCPVSKEPRGACNNLCGPICASALLKYEKACPALHAEHSEQCAAEAESKRAAEEKLARWKSHKEFFSCYDEDDMPNPALSKEHFKHVCVPEAKPGKRVRVSSRKCCCPVDKLTFTERFIGFMPRWAPGLDFSTLCRMTKAENLAKLLNQVDMWEGKATGGAQCSQAMGVDLYRSLCSSVQLDSTLREYTGRDPSDQDRRGSVPAPPSSSAHRRGSGHKLVLEDRRSDGTPHRAPGKLRAAVAPRERPPREEEKPTYNSLQEWAMAGLEQAVNNAALSTYNAVDNLAKGIVDAVAPNGIQVNAQVQRDWLGRVRAVHIP